MDGGRSTTQHQSAYLCPRTPEQHTTDRIDVLVDNRLPIRHDHQGRTQITLTNLFGYSITASNPSLATPVATTQRRSMVFIAHHAIRYSCKTTKMIRMGIAMRDATPFETIRLRTRSDISDITTLTIDHSSVSLPVVPGGKHHSIHS